MRRFIQIMAIGLVALGTARADGQTCVGGVAARDTCGSAYALPGTEGHHVVFMDASTATGTPTYCSATVGKTVWFEVTPTVSGPMVFSTCHPSTTYDTVIQAFSGGNSECQGMASEGCNDDGVGAYCDNGCSYAASTVSINATAGVRYRFEVGAYGDNSEGCTLCLGVVLTIGSPCGLSRALRSSTSEISWPT